jgi:hypothetical protein
MLIKLLSAKQSAKKRGGSREECSINIEDLLELLDTNNNTCIITGKKLSFIASSPWQASIDRINSQKGYTKDNIQIVALEVNVSCYTSNIKENYYEATNEDWKNIFNDSILNNNYNIDEILTKFKRLWNSKPIDVGIIYEVENKKEYERQCYTILPRHSFGRLCRSNNLSRHGKDNSLNVNDIYEIFISQNGLCAYSMIPMSLHPGNRKVSLERINSTLPHTKENCILVCRMLNPTEHKGDNLGMSREKFLQILDTTPLLDR